MKYLILILLCFSACKPKEVSKVVIPVADTVVVKTVVVVRDTIYLEKKYDSLEVVIKAKNDSLFVERFKIERVKYYNNIALRNKNQLKFLPGWINRATK